MLARRTIDFEFIPGDAVLFAGADSRITGKVERVMATLDARRLVEVRHKTMVNGTVSDQEIVNWYGEEVLIHAPGCAQVRFYGPITSQKT